MVWLVDADMEARISRVMDRDGTSREAVVSRVQNQMDSSEKKKLSAEIIDNSKGKEELYQQIEYLLMRYVKNKGKRAYRVLDFLHEHVIAIIIAVVVLAGVISTIAIVKGDVKTSSEKENSIQYEEMSTIYFAMDPVKSLNPLSSQDRDVYYISQLMFSSLFKLNENLNIEPDLVSSYTANSGSGTVSIKLREGRKIQ